MPGKNGPIVEMMRRLSGDYPRFGSRRIRIMLAREGIVLGKERCSRLWAQAGLQVPRKRRRRRIAGSRPRPLAPSARNAVWSYDFVFDACANGQQLKCLTVVDEYTRKCLAIDVSGSIRSARVIEGRATSQRRSLRPSQRPGGQPDQRENLDHFPVSARTLEQHALQLPKGNRKLSEGRAVAKRSRFALQDCQVVTPVVDGFAAIMAAIDTPVVLRNHLTLLHDEQMVLSAVELAFESGESRLLDSPPVPPLQTPQAFALKGVEQADQRSRRATLYAKRQRPRVFQKQHDAAQEREKEDPDEHRMTQNRSKGWVRFRCKSWVRIRCKSTAPTSELSAEPPESST